MCVRELAAMVRSMTTQLIAVVCLTSYTAEASDVQDERNGGLITSAGDIIMYYCKLGAAHQQAL